jgi:hypothetical protein
MGYKTLMTETRILAEPVCVDVVSRAWTGLAAHA